MPAVERGLQAGKHALEFRIVAAVLDAGAGVRDRGAIAAEIDADLREAQAEMDMRKVHRRLPREGRRGAPALFGAELAREMPSAAGNQRLYEAAGAFPSSRHAPSPPRPAPRPGCALSQPLLVIIASHKLGLFSYKPVRAGGDKSAKLDRPRGDNKNEIPGSLGGADRMPRVRLDAARMSETKASRDETGSTAERIGGRGRPGARRLTIRAGRRGATTACATCRSSPASTRSREFGDTAEQVEAIVARLERALSAERNRARSGHWTYDLNRHIALRQAHRAETERLSALRDATALRHGFC